MTAKRAKRKAPIHPRSSAASRALLWAPVALSLLGIGVSGYLVVKRFTGGGLACTRWAQCDVVNNSLYSQIYGVPVSLLGLIGYLALLAAAASALITAGRARRRALGLGFLMALGGFGFSLWLTYVEVYIIEALCSWCVASALIITLLTAVGALNLRGRGAGAS
jgi:uncharacterized membrane protein